jgi:hypothetical protein
MSGSLVVQNSNFPTAQEFQTMKELGAMAVASGFLPASIKTPEQAVVIMLKGRELGIGPMEAFSKISVIQGKPCMDAELMLSMGLKKIPGLVVNVLETTNTNCTIEAKRPGGKLVSLSFNWEDATRAGLTNKDNWKKYPGTMLRWRAISAIAKIVFPDALSGVSHTPDELGAIVDEDGSVVSRDVTPPTNPEPTKQPVPQVTRPIAQAVASRPVTGVPTQTHADHAQASDARIEAVVSQNRTEEVKTFYPSQYPTHLSADEKGVKRYIEDFATDELYEAQKSLSTWRARSPNSFSRAAEKGLQLIEEILLSRMPSSMEQDDFESSFPKGYVK